MIKNPERGKVKTRLAQSVGDDAALRIYLQLLAHTNDVAMQVEVDRFLFYSNVVDRNDPFDNTAYKKYVQCSGDLGTRMEYAFSIPFKNEYKKVVMIGSDCYAIGKDHISEAFTQLDQHDFVIGPALDGGYYLIGMKKWNRWIFHHKNWSTETLFAETKTEILGNKAGLFELEPLRDIDTVDDLNHTPSLLSL